MEVKCFYCGNDITEGGDPRIDLRGRRLCDTCYSRLTDIVEGFVRKYKDIVDRQ